MSELPEEVSTEAEEQGMVETTAKPIGALMVERGLLEERALEAALTEQTLTGERLGTILVRNGFVTRRELVATLADTEDPEVLSEPFESDRVEAGVLVALRVMLLGDTGDRLLLATDSPHWWVEQQLRPLFPGRSFEFMGYDPEIFEQHLQNLASYRDEGPLDRVLRTAIMHGVSDIHLLPKPETYTLMYRRLGVREMQRDYPREEAVRVIAQAKDRAGADMADSGIPQDGAFQRELMERRIDFRIATIPESDGEKLVIRVLDPEATYPRLESLGLRGVDAWLQAARQPNGLCFVCGPTGSGKSTTLNATIRRLDRFGASIQTIEDPVEHRLSYIGQVEVNRARGLDFPRALRGFLRADPDVVVVGEIRDLETARLAVQAAETGHMVFATLHADSVAGALWRLRDMGVPTEDFAPLLRGVLAQKLLRTRDPDSPAKGYVGRTLAAELARFDSADDVHRAIGGECWWSSIADDVRARLAAGETDEAEVERVLGSAAVTA